MYALIDQIPSKYQRRRQQPIYLFVRPPPLNLPKSYISLHFWSLHEDGQSQLSDESCDDFGLFTKPLYFTYDFHSFSWSTAHYKRLHEYQLSRGFDPKTINFARYLGYDHHIFQLTNDSDRFEDVLEGALTLNLVTRALTLMKAKRKCRNGVGESIINPGSEGPSNTRDHAQHLVGDTDFCGILQGTPCDRKDKSTISEDRVANNTEPGGLESDNHPYQVCYCIHISVLPFGPTCWYDLHEYVTITIDIASNGPRPRSSGSALGGHDGTDLLAWNAIDVAHPVPSIDLVNNTITITHDAGNAQNIGTYVAPSGTADSRLHDDGSIIQLIPPVRRQARASPIRSFAPPSLVSRVLAILSPSPITVEVLSESIAPPSNTTATLRPYLPSNAPTNPRRNQRHLVKNDGVLSSSPEAQARADGVLQG
ncbi:hypothetical protein AAF712_012502 [Marasmius tenuissimus]|uniref:Uncharacterized protein n=1 Tax=Marasmius tenuissimus TaxID=585030 RepID=A0ABR2ZGC5_9AGAR